MKNKVIALAEVVSRLHSGVGVSSTRDQRAAAFEALREALVSFNDDMVRCLCARLEMLTMDIRAGNIGIYGPDQNYGEVPDGGYADPDCSICGGFGRV